MLLVFVSIICTEFAGCWKLPNAAEPDYELLRSETKTEARDGWSWLFLPDPLVIGRAYQDELKATLANRDSKLVSIMIAKGGYRPKKSSALWNTSVILSGEKVSHVPDYTSGVWSLFILLPRGLPPSNNQNYAIPVYVLLARDDVSETANAWAMWASKHGAIMARIETQQGHLPARWGDSLEKQLLVLGNAGRSGFSR